MVAASAALASAVALLNDDITVRPGWVAPLMDYYPADYDYADFDPGRQKVATYDGKVWFAEYQAERIGMFDPSTASMKEWKTPTPWSAPYDAVAGKNGEAWTGSMLTDRVSRLDIKSGQYVDYQLPRPTNIRRVFMEDKSPGILWVGNNHGGSIIKVEPLE